MSVKPTIQRFSVFCLAILVLSIASVCVAQTCEDYSDFIHVIGALHRENNGPSGAISTVMAKSGNTICTSAGSYISLIDVSAPETPVLQDWVRLWDNSVWDEIRGMAFFGDYVLVNSNSFFTVVQVDNIAEPTVVGVLPLDNSGGGGDIAFSGTLALVARGNAGVAVIDLSDPSSPDHLMTIPQGGSISNLTISGEHLFITDAGPVLNIFNISDPLMPFLEGSTPLIASGSDVVIDGNLALVCHGYNGGLELIDITTMSAPLSIGSLLLPDEPNHIDVAGNSAVLGCYDGQLVVVDIQTPANPELTARFPVPGYGSALTAAGDLVFLASDWTILTVVDLGNRTNAPTTAELGQIQAFSVLDVVDDRAYVGEGKTFRIFDVSTPSSPFSLGEVSVAGNIKDIDVVGNIAYVGDDFAGLHLIDVSAPTAPSVMGEAYIPGYFEGLDVAGNYVYLACEQIGVTVVDASNPADPYIIAWVGTADEADDIQVVGTTAYVADSQGGLHILDVSNPNDPVLLGLTGVPDGIHSLAVAGTTVFAGSYNGLWSIDVSNPARPEILDYEAAVLDAGSIVLSGTNAYVNQGRGGAAVVDVSDPAAMLLLGATAGSEQTGYQDYGNNDIANAGDYVFYIDRGVMVISPLQCGSSAAAGGPQIMAVPVVLMQNFPNPFNPSTTIAFELAQEQPVSLRIYDLQGRLVRTLADGEMTGAGPHQATWQGKDGAGQTVAAGIYLYELVTPTVQQVRRMTLIK
jgi:hypothetical protein